MKKSQHIVRVFSLVGWILGWLAGCFVSGPVYAVKSSSTNQTAAVNPKMVLKEVEEKYRKSNTLSANFTQLERKPTLKKALETRGQLWVKRPLQLRWQVTSPDPQVLVGDGKYFWFYTPPFNPSDANERGQVIKSKQQSMASDILRSLLIGDFSTHHDFLISPDSASFKDPNGLIFYKLTPKKKGAAGTVNGARVGIDRHELLIHEVELNHADGATAKVRLEDIRLGEALDPGLFKLDIPPKTDQIEQ